MHAPCQGSEFPLWFYEHYDIKWESLEIVLFIGWAFANKAESDTAQTMNVSLSSPLSKEKVVIFLLFFPISSIIFGFSVFIDRV